MDGSHDIQIITVGGAEVQVIPDGMPVPGPGLYRMSMTHYHSQACCPGPSVSSTGIRKAALQSPHAFWKTWDGNPDRYPPKPEGDSLVLGKAAHSLILGDEVFREHFIFVPEDAPRRPTATQIKAFERDGEWSEAAAPGAEFWAEFDKRAAGRHLLSPDQMTALTRMAENLGANPLAMEMLISDMIELSLIWQDDATGLWIKSRPDCIPSNGYDFGDLKTFSPKGRDLRLSAIRSCTDFGYPMQMALAVEGAERILGGSTNDCGLVFIQTTEPWEVIPIILDEEALHWARVLNRKGMDLIAHGLESGDWPGVGADPIQYEYPASMLHRFGEMQAAGLLPKV